QGKVKGLAACNSQTASPFGCLNNFYFEILSNFLGSLHCGAAVVFLVVFTMACRGKYLATLRRGMVQSRWARGFKSIVLKIERINWNLTGGA
ncbi:MAG: hypothetical protein ACLUEM_06530, partial [Oscillospiraceae bacterium]